ncbi:glycosyltransferase [Candidatus Pacearchaeota archaeon]|nr:glycosyltransferase [Candidatus Pacearchaeota archaeon]
MKIAFVVHNFPKLSETFILNQIIGLIDMGHEVDIYAHSPSGEEIIHKEIIDYGLLEKTFYYERFTSRRYNSFPIKLYYQFLGFCGRILKDFSPVIYSELKKKIPDKEDFKIKPQIKISSDFKEKNYDIILCHFGTNGYNAINLKNLGILNGKIVVFFNGRDMSCELISRGDNFYNELFMQSNLFIPICHFFGDKFLKLGYTPRKIKVLRLGVDCSKFRIASKTQKDEINILTIARLVEKKGLEYSIRTVAELLKKYPSLRYTIIGDGELKKPLKKLIKKLKAESNILLVGDKPRDEILKCFSETDIFVLSSITAKNGDTEGTPISIMEAMASGIPVVSTYHSGIPEVVKDEVSGFLVSEKDIGSLYKKIELLINNSSLRKKMGIEGRKIIEKDFNIKILNKKLVKILQEVVNS